MKRLLTRIVVAALPLAGAGCNCADDPVNEYKAIPNGVSGQKGMSLPESVCVDACGWVLNMDGGMDGGFSYGGSSGPPRSLAIDWSAPHQCRLDLDPNTRSLMVYCQYFVRGDCVPLLLPGARRPWGLRPAGKVAAANPVGRFFARQAHAEAAAVFAFEQLEAELVAHGAPASLWRAARRARADEVRHARITTALARRFGVEPPDVVVESPPEVRSLLAIAIENVSEGCVGETWGALHAEYQARTKAGTALGGTLRAIANDEHRHAALAWAVDRWARGHLGARDHRVLNEAMESAAARLSASVRAPVEAELQVEVGVPDTRAALAMMDAARGALWAA